MRKALPASALMLVVVCVSVAFGQDRARSIRRGSVWDDPERRERMYDRMAERYLDDLGEAYDLTDGQRDQIAERLEAIKAAQRAYGDAHREEFVELREQMREAWRDRQDGEDPREAIPPELRDRMRELWQNAPLMNPDKVVAEAEKLLPAEQVDEGRAKWQALREQRMREGWGPGRGGFGGDRGPGGFGRGERDEVDPWQRYVDSFCETFRLDAAQQATAYSILRDVQERRNKLQARRSGTIDAARRIEDREERRERMQETMREILAGNRTLMEELRTRLDRVPTSAQIAAVRQAAVTQSEAATATRPSDYVRSPGFGGGRFGRGFGERSDNRDERSNNRDGRFGDRDGNDRQARPQRESTTRPE